MTSILLDSAAGLQDDCARRSRNGTFDTRPVFPASSQYPIWGRTFETGPAAARIGRQGLNLPSDVRRERVEYLGEAIWLDRLAVAWRARPARGAVLGGLTRIAAQIRASYCLRDIATYVKRWFTSFDAGSRRHMPYNGNDYGRAAIGLAVSGSNR